jgi:hypothetical protein
MQWREKMTKHDYRLTAQELLEHCEDIARSYSAQRLTLTVRQLYYQLVARGLEDNGQHVYKRVVSVLSTARLNGSFPMDLLEDRGRDAAMTGVRCELDVETASLSIQQALRNAPASFIRADPWFGQEVLPFVWVEKEALAGVFEAPCKQMSVGLFPCKGYPSLQSLWSWVSQVAEADAAMRQSDEARDILELMGLDISEVWQRVVVLYFGDHDPDGLEIPESALRNIEQLQDAHGLEYYTPIEFRRVALTKEQIRTYRPPPFPAKESSSRFSEYVRKTGLTDAWELDALEPRVLQNLIRTELEDLFDRGRYGALRAQVEGQRERLRAEIAADGWIERALSDSGE